MKVCDYLEYTNILSQKVFKLRKITLFHPENRHYFWVYNYFSFNTAAMALCASQNLTLFFLC